MIKKKSFKILYSFLFLKSSKIIVVLFFINLFLNLNKLRQHATLNRPSIKMRLGVFFLKKIFTELIYSLIFFKFKNSGYENSPTGPMFTNFKQFFFLFFLVYEDKNFYPAL